MHACLGLDNAILGGLGADERRMDGARIAELLAHGAHSLAAPEEEATKEGEAFEREVGRCSPLLVYLSLVQIGIEQCPFTWRATRKASGTAQTRLHVTWTAEDFNTI